MKAIWKAIQHIPVLSRVQPGSETWDNELNPYKREILQYAYVFLEESTATQEEVEEAVRVIGHNAYVGGKEAGMCAAQYLPHMIAMVQNDDVSRSLKLQILKSLSEICHRSREAQKKIRYQGMLATISKMIGEINDPLFVRWSCYLLYICMADNIPFIRDVIAIPGIKEKLEHAATLPWGWEGWPGNLPGIILMVMGHRGPSGSDPSMMASSSHDTDM